jgi:hypothetical protein
VVARTIAPFYTLHVRIILDEESLDKKAQNGSCAVRQRLSCSTCPSAWATLSRGGGQLCSRLTREIAICPAAYGHGPNTRSPMPLQKRIQIVKMPQSESRVVVDAEIALVRVGQVRGDANLEFIAERNETSIKKHWRRHQKPAVCHPNRLVGRPALTSRFDVARRQQVLHGDVCDGTITHRSERASRRRGRGDRLCTATRARACGTGISDHLPPLAWHSGHVYPMRAAMSRNYRSSSPQHHRPSTPTKLSGSKRTVKYFPTAFRCRRCRPRHNGAPIPETLFFRSLRRPAPHPPDASRLLACSLQICFPHSR